MRRNVKYIQLKKINLNLIGLELLNKIMPCYYTMASVANDVTSVANGVAPVNDEVLATYLDLVFSKSAFCKASRKFRNRPPIIATLKHGNTLSRTLSMEYGGSVYKVEEMILNYNGYIAMKYTVFFSNGQHYARGIVSNIVIK